MSTPDSAPAQSVVIALRRGASVLFLRRADGDGWDGLWWLPGGACEPDETPLAAAGREVVEETGLAPELLHAVDERTVYAPTGQGRTFTLLVADAPDGDVVLSDEHDAARWAEPTWFHAQDLDALRATDGLFEGWLDGIAVPFIGHLASRFESDAAVGDFGN